MREPPKRRRRPQLEDVEPRILMSADHPLAAGLVGAAPAGGEAPIQAVVPAVATPSTRGVEVVIVDGRVTDADVLIAELVRAAGDTPLDIHRLDPGEDGLAAISAVLDSHQGNVAALHLIGHGDAGRMQLGATRVDGDLLLERADAFVGWQAALDADADLLLYGCDFAATDAGRELIADLVLLTGADVAASTNATGATALGGDWRLEAATGAIESSLAGALAMAEPTWQGVLATLFVTNTNDTGAGSLRQAITTANAAAGGSYIIFDIGGTGVHTIQLDSALPALVKPIVIAGTSDIGSVRANGGRPEIVLDGKGGSFAGLTLNTGSANSEIRGLVLKNFNGDGIVSNVNGVRITGNYIGRLTAAGTLASNGISGWGVRIVGGSRVAIGGSDPAERNVIVGATAGGIYLPSSTGRDQTIRGNYLGVLPDGSAAPGLLGYGIQTDSASLQGLMIGGPGPTDGNWIANTTQHGIYIQTVSSWMTITGNRIGTDAAGTADWGTGGDGILLASSSSRGTVSNNVIAYSGGAGIREPGSSGSTRAFVGNRIYGSTGLGIDLGTAGVTANDAGDGDTGPNGLQNFPVLSSASASGDSLYVAGTLNSTANQAFRVELFASPTRHGSTYGEGQTYLGHIDVVTDGSGNASFARGLIANVAAGHYVSATATRVGTGFNPLAQTGSEVTSEFSLAVQAGAMATLVVNTTSDVIDGNTGSPALLAASPGSGNQLSLAEALTAANNSTVPTRIRIEIPGDTIHRIALTTALPAITKPVIIDGFADTGSVAANGGRPAIEIDASATSAAAAAILRLEAGSQGSVIRGLAMLNGPVDGIALNGGHATVVGNYIGRIGANGTPDGGSGIARFGISVSSAGNQIGGSTAAERNVIAGMQDFAIALASGANTNRVSGNWIGVLPSGSAILAGGNGIRVNQGLHNVIGGPGDGDGNWIAGTANGIRAEQITGPIQIRGNRIGTDLAGTANWGTQAAGIHLSDVTDGMVRDNVVANSGTVGITVLGTTTRAPLLGNRVTGSAGLGIDLGGNGTTANDGGDGDSGPNAQQNFPSVTTATTNGVDAVNIVGTLNSVATQRFRIEFFASPNGDGEGAIYLGREFVTADGSGNRNFNVTFVTPLPAGLVITATATRVSSTVDHATHYETSEFSAPWLLTAVSGALTHRLPYAPAIAAEDTERALTGLAARTAAATITTTLSVAHGSVALTLAGGASISAGANQSATLTVTGSVAAVNATLATLRYRGAPGYYGGDSLTVASTDSNGGNANNSVEIWVATVIDPTKLIVVTTATDNNDAGKQLRERRDDRPGEPPLRVPGP